MGIHPAAEAIGSFTILPVGSMLWSEQSAEAFDLCLSLIGPFFFLVRPCDFRRGDLTRRQHTDLPDGIPQAQLPAGSLQMELQHLARNAASHRLDRLEVIADAP